jgi:zinc/manganese transport system permease protein
MQIIELLWPAFVLAIALVFIHTIFGLEIIERGVIFTDLAIGQIAAIGMALSIAFMGGEYQSAMTFLFAFFGAILITWATKRIEKIEAFIGLLYAFGISSIMLILAKSSEGVELFSKLSAADILFTSSDELMVCLSIYGFIAFMMFVIYPKIKGIFREFFFFLMLAITVTSSVQSAGVLVVFSLLIAPSFAGITSESKKPFLFATIFGSVSILIALVSSYNFDLPTGYTIIFISVTSSLFYVAVKAIK